MKKIFALMAVVSLLGLNASYADAADGAKLFKSKCKMCHSLDKKKMGPAVKSMVTDAAALHTIITDGRKMMPKFGKKLDAEQIDSLVAYIQEQQK